ncbi:unnamed protein product [Pararhodospirillum photometricum DSM 122]|uniref:Uncharacterized protein n=1 Tax=Pararhodospirillum photometricum DSM 122 TaxID=1150469 RepID=H6SNI7_PARPM|nr:unnamed protein product [Pararhodospirillum photometricum DSM 122]
MRGPRVTEPPPPRVSRLLRADVLQESLHLSAQAVALAAQLAGGFQDVA